MGRAGSSLRAATWVALTYSALLWTLALFPFHRYLTPERRLLVAAGGCGLAASLMESVRADPAVEKAFLPVITARRIDRGAENALSEESCRMIAQDLRSNAWWLTWVPRRFLCQDVRRHVREAYNAAGLHLGADILVYDDEAVGNWVYYTEVTRLGFEWVAAGSGIRLVPIAR